MVQNLTEGTLGAFEVVSRRLDAQEETLQKIDQRTQRVEDRIQRLEDGMQRVEHGMNAILRMLQARPLVNQPAPPVPGEEGKVAEDEEGKSFHCFLCLLFFEILTFLSDAPPSPPPPPPPRRDVNTALQGRSIAPPMDASLPKTLVLLRAEWVSKNLGDFTPHVSWGRSMNASYKKREYLMKDIKRRRQADGSSLVEASVAVDLQRRRLSKTVTQYWSHLKDHDSSVERRVVQPRRLEHDRDMTPPRRRV